MGSFPGIKSHDHPPRIFEGGSITTSLCGGSPPQKLGDLRHKKLAQK